MPPRTMTPAKPPAKRAPAKQAAPRAGRSVVRDLIAPTDAFVAQSADHVVQELPIGKVKPDPNNVRRDLGDIGELTKSVTEKGVLQPLTVTADGPGWMVVFGHRRLAAAKAAKHTTVPCIVRDFDPLDRLETQVAENLHRADLTPIEEAIAYRRLAELGASQRRIVTKVARSQSHISKRLSLLELPERIQDRIEAREITIGDALELTRLAELPNAKQLMNAAVGSNAARTYGVRVAVDETIAKHEEAAKRAAALEQLQRDKIPVVDYRRYGYSNTYTPIGKSYDELDVSKERCTKDGTLAGAVRPDGTIEWVCTDAKRYHAAVDDNARTGETAAERKERLANERADAAAKEAHTARQVAIAKLVGGLDTWTFPKGDIGPLLRLLAFALVDQAQAESDVCDALGIELDGANRTWNEVQEHSAQGDRQLFQAAVAVALCTLDPGSRSDFGWATTRGDDDELPKAGVVTLIGALEELAGYTPSLWELEQLGRIPSPAAADDTATSARARKG